MLWTVDTHHYLGFQKGEKNSTPTACLADSTAPIHRALSGSMLVSERIWELACFVTQFYV